METRIRRFINYRRSQSVEAENAIIHQSLPYETSSPSQQTPTSTNGSKVKDLSKPRKRSDSDVARLRTSSYEQCQPGKPPVFGTLPQKGNGPIKLQTSRRLSSGDLIITAQDSQRTLQDIRNGQYVVGKRDRHLSHSSGRRNTNPIEPHSLPISQLNRSSLAPPSVQPPFTSQTCPNTPTLPYEPNQPSYQGHINHFNTEVGLGLSPSSAWNRPRQSQDSFNDTASSLSHHSMSLDNSKRGMNQMSDTNATLKALRKAEYSRLVELYGLDAANSKIAQLDREHLKTPSSPMFPTDAPYSSLILEPLPPPPIEKADTESTRMSHASRTSDQCYDQWSVPSSPQHASRVSSYAESSADTGQTSLVEEDSANTRENIRNMVVQLRSSYLNALESRSAPPVKSKLRTKPRKPKLKPSPIILVADQVPPLPKLPVASRQTWHPPNAENKVSPRRRVNSQPVESANSIEIQHKSHSQIKDIDSGVQRADSTTLGNLMADLTRDKAKSRKSVKARFSRDQNSNSERPKTPQLQVTNDPNIWLDRASNGSDQLHDRQRRVQSVERSDHTRPSQNSNPAVEELDELFTNELWTSPSFSSHTSDDLDLRQTRSHDSTHYNTQYELTPRKTMFIPAIPESPEYTHLARDENPETNFI